MIKGRKCRFLDACRRSRWYYLFVVLLISLVFLGYERVYPSDKDYNSAKPLLYMNEPLNYGHLQSLKEMFSNAAKNVMEGKFKGSLEINMSDLQELERREKVLLVVIVSTAPSRNERREAIRKTWWKKCSGKVVCKFFTDGLGLSATEQLSLAKEQLLNKDIEIQPLKMGRSFGMRYLYHIMYAAAKYQFTYLLRIDDDYFVCMERLLNELHNRPVKMLSWGSYHCLFRDRVYMDEAWTLFTADVIQRFLSQNPRKILCHPHADQQIPVWLENVYKKNETLINFDDQRLHHYPPAWKQEKFKSLTRVCDRYIGVHGSSPEMMLKFWRNSGDEAKEITNITDVSRTCHFPTVFNISKIRPPYKFALRPCIENPIWTPNEGMWLGVGLGAQKQPKKDKMIK